MKNTAVIFAILLVASVVLAAGGAHDSHEGVPLDKIGWQAANFGVLLVAIVFFIRKSIKEAFQNRQKNYLERSEKTKAALKEAEAALAGIKRKLSDLESGEKKSLENAQHEANILKAHIIKEAESAAEKIKADANKAIENELTKAKSEINAKILTQAIGSAKDALSTKSAATANQEMSFVKQLERAST